MLPLNEVNQLSKKLRYSSRAKYFADDYAISPSHRMSYGEIEPVHHVPEHYSE